MRVPRVLILYNEPVLPANHPDAESEHEILFTVESVSKTLVQAGFQVSRLGISHDPDLLLSGLRSQRPDAVFNLFEGTADDGNNEAYVAGVLEWLDIPFTGSPCQTLCMARNKPLTKTLLQGAGLPTPEFFVVNDLPEPECTLEWPVIVKPATQDASVGLDQGSVVTDPHRLQERVAYLLKTYGPPVLVEQFIRGRELNVALIEAPTLRVLPISEVLFVEKDPSYWPIVTYDAKWKPGSRDYEATPARYPADVTAKLAERLGGLARQAFRLLGCRDYARVDFRVRAPGKPFILEINPNPDFSPTAGLAGGLASAGLTHPQFTVDLVRAALARGKKPRLLKPKKSAELRTRAPRPGDREAVRQILEGCGVFRPEELATTLKRFDSALANGKANGYHFVVVEQEDRVAGYACYGKAPPAEDSYHLHGLAVAASLHGQGLGYHLLRAVEAEVAAAGGRVLVVETSSQPSRIQARQFFLRQGYRLAGDVPDFYREGEARLTYAKYLSSGRS
jgi:D-alanine-D-alanine ligase